MMDNNVLLPSASSESDLVKDIVKNNNLFDDSIGFKNVIEKTKQLIETDLDNIVQDVIDKTKKCNLDHIKSNSDPSINSNNKETVIDESNKSINNSINKSMDKLITKTTKIDDKPIQFTNQQPIQKKLLRGISRATDNIELTSKLRSIFAYDFQAIKDNDSFNDNLNLDLPDHTFTLPDISIHQDDFRQFLEKDLIEKSTLTSLKQAKRLNWWNSDELNLAQKLWPIVTSGDGNCLLHACSLAIWGFHDRLLTLRKALHYYLINAGNSNESSFYKRWRYQTTLENKKAGLILCEDEWKNDWQNLLKMASSEPRVVGHITKTTKTIELNGGKKEICEEVSNHVYESLESFHLFALANLLKRTIIVIADKTLKDVSGQDFAPIPFGGIYLPLKCEPKECNKTPLCLTYDAAHFSSLVAMDRESYADKTPLEPAIIPLVDYENILLPIQFAIEPPSDLKWNKDEYDDNIIEKLNISESDKIDLLDKYLDLVYVNKNTKEIYSSEEFKKKQNQDKESKLEEPCQLQSITIELTENLDQNNQKELKTQKQSKQSQLNTITTESEKKRKFYFGSLSSLTIKFNSLKRSVSKKFRRNLNLVNSNINSLARSSFRLSRRISRLNKNESQTKSANNLDTTTLSTNSLLDKSSPSRSSTKSSTNRSPSKLSNKQSPIKSIDKTVEESIIPKNFILAADMHISNKPEYRDQLIHNYLVSARLRFINETKNNKLNLQKPVIVVNSNDDQLSSNKDSIESCVSSNNSLINDDDFVNQCVNTGCVNFGKSSTNYLCENCYINQKKELIEIRNNNETTIKTESVFNI